MLRSLIAAGLAAGLLVGMAGCGSDRVVAPSNPSTSPNNKPKDNTPSVSGNRGSGKIQPVNK